MEQSRTLYTGVYFHPLHYELTDLGEALRIPDQPKITYCAKHRRSSTWGVFNAINTFPVYIFDVILQVEFVDFKLPTLDPMM